MRNWIEKEEFDGWWIKKNFDKFVWWVDRVIWKD